MSNSKSLEWTSQFEVSHESIITSLPGDKIVLPPSALEQLLAAAPIVSDDGVPLRTQDSTFDPFNPYSYAAERHARVQTRYEQQQLPHPLTFRLVNPSNGRIVYAGIKEFSAEDGHAVLSQFLAQALGIDLSRKTTSTHGGESEEQLGIETQPQEERPKFSKITVHAQQLPKGTFVKLRPLEAGYDPENWKSLLEGHLRKNYTTLTRGELLTVPAGRNEHFQFLVDEFKPEGDGICVVDTDLEVDIEALNEEQARETVKKITEKRQKAPGSTAGSSPGGQLHLLRKQEGQVLDGEYVDYELPSWDRRQGLEIELVPGFMGESLEVFVSPFSNLHRAKPRDDEHVFDAYEGRPSKRVRLSPTTVDLEDAEAIWISVHSPRSIGSESATLKHYIVRASPFDIGIGKSYDHEMGGENIVPNVDEVSCSNCHQIVPKRSLMLHENFCLRNNIACPKGCGQVFQKRLEAWQDHWHCPHDASYGEGSISHERHDQVFHERYNCSNCNYIASSLPLLAHHRTSTCPGKLILCRFCLLEVPQEGDPDGIPNAEVLLSGMTPHELADGARTTECHMCQRIVRLRDMNTHLKHHDLERFSRSAPRLCRNIYCGRTLDGTSASGDTRSGSRMGQGAGNDIGLCSTCFGPLYVSMYDPEGKALRRRVERRYLSQLLNGCGKSWCRNEFCKAGRKHGGVDVTGTGITTKDALPMIKPFVDGLTTGATSLHFCVDETSQARRQRAQMLSAQVGQIPGQRNYALEWCIGALEAEGGNLDKAVEWLKNFAPFRGESR